MKKSFTLFSVSALFLMLLFPVSVKAADTVLKFSWTTTENHDSKNWPADADFSYSGPIDDGCKYWDADWAGMNGGITASSRTTYSLKSGDYTFTLRLQWRNEDKSNCNVPKIQLNNGTQVTHSQVNLVNGAAQNLEYTVNVPADGDYTIKVISQDGDRDKFGVSTLTIPDAAFVPATPTYAVSATASNGTVSGTGSYAEGAEVTLTASPNENYSFTGWSSSDISIANASANPLVFSMPAKAVSVTATFAECIKHTVTLTAGANGSVSGGGEQCDGSVTVTATPDDGYRFVNWTQGGSQVSTDAVYTFTLSEDISLTANFEVDPCSNSLTIQCEENTYQIDPALKTKGMSIPAYKLGDGWYTGADGNYVDFNNHEGEIYYIIDLPAATYSFTVYKAHAGKSYLNIWEAGIDDELTYNGVNYGKHHGDAYNIIGDDAGGQYTPIHNSTISDVALSAGTYIIGLYGNSYAVYDKVVITANSNVFCPTYDITMVNNMGGAAPTADKVKAEENASVSISADATIGEFSFTGWSASPAVTFADASAASTTFTMPDEAVTITANYNTYSRTGAPAIQNGNYGTICLPLNGTVTGATLYSIAGKEVGATTYVVLEDKGTSLEAGKPYIFQLSANELSVALDGTYTDLQAGNGLVGTYETIDLTPYAEPSTLNYFLYENAFKKAGTDVTVGAYRAYLNLDEVGAVTPAPGARRIRMVIEGTNSATGLEDLINDQLPVTSKVLIDGQLFIIREGKRYTLTGARAQ